MLLLPASPSDDLELSKSTVLVPSPSSSAAVPSPTSSTIPAPGAKRKHNILTPEEASLASLSCSLPPIHGPADVNRLDLDLTSASASELESEEEGLQTPPLAATFAHAAEFARVLVLDDEHDDDEDVHVPLVKSKLIVVPIPTAIVAAPTPAPAPIATTTTTTAAADALSTCPSADAPTQPEQPTFTQRLLENACPLGYGLTVLCYGLTCGEKLSLHHATLQVEDLEAAGPRVVAFDQQDQGEITEEKVYHGHLRPRGVEMKREITKEDKELAAAGYEHLEDQKTKHKLGQPSELDKVDLTEHALDFTELPKYIDCLLTMFNILLIIAGVLEYVLLGIDFKDSFANTYLGGMLIAVAFLNAFIEFYQLQKSEAILASFLAMIPPSCRVVRDAILTSIPAADLVKGDVVLVRVGDKTPADLILFAATDLKVDNSSLTGESEPQERFPKPDGAHVRPVEAENLGMKARYPKKYRPFRTSGDAGVEAEAGGEGGQGQTRADEGGRRRRVGVQQKTVRATKVSVGSSVAMVQASRRSARGESGQGRTTSDEGDAWAAEEAGRGPRRPGRMRTREGAGKGNKIDEGDTGNKDEDARRGRRGRTQTDEGLQRRRRRDRGSAERASKGGRGRTRACSRSRRARRGKGREERAARADADEQRHRCRDRARAERADEGVQQKPARMTKVGVRAGVESRGGWRE
ncbi:hypothetical protein BDW22DRAFT_1439769 [Trametopsis cervina]|nr:hypothetical protein BDW22DRAFT_1439769 [Trametopsis cervina]